MFPRLEYSDPPPPVREKSDVPIFQEWSRLKREAALTKVVVGLVLFAAGILAIAVLRPGLLGDLIGSAVAAFGLYWIATGSAENSRVRELRESVVARDWDA